MSCKSVNPDCHRSSKLLELKVSRLRFTPRDKINIMTRKINRRKNLKLIAMIAGFFLIICLGIYFWLRPNTSGTVIPSTTPHQTFPASGQKQQAAENAQQYTDSKTANTSNSSTNSGSSLISPSGTFVSNHHPNLSGTPAPSTEQSVCNTTPGAYCYIEFTNGSQIKKLSSQMADSNGSVYWDWDVNSAGLSVGSWHITTVASLNGKTKSTSDSLDLVVQQ